MSTHTGGERVASSPQKPPLETPPLETPPLEVAPVEVAPVEVARPSAASPTVSAPPSASLPDGLQTMATRAPRLARTIQFGWRLGERWGFDRCPLIAAAMAFFGLLSVFPLMLAFAAIFGKYLAVNPQVRDNLLSSSKDFFPDAARKVLEDQVKAIAQTTNTTTVGVASIVSLLWSGRAFFDTLASVLNSIWLGAKPRTWLQHQIAMWSTFLGAGVLFLLSTAATFALTAVRSMKGTLPNVFINQQPLLWNGITRLVAFLLTTFMFWMIYRFLPNAERGNRGRIALGSALVAAVGWELAKLAFARYLGNTARYGAIYGGVAGVVLTMMWLYFSSMIILLGAEAAAAYQETRAAALGLEKPTRDTPADTGEALPESGPASAPDIVIHAIRDDESVRTDEIVDADTLSTPTQGDQRGA